MSNNKLQGIIGTVLLHGIILLILCLVFLSRTETQEESGVPVMLGETEISQGNADPYTLTDVDIMEESVLEQPVPDISDPYASNESVITQEEEETIAMKPETSADKKEVKREPVKEQLKKEVVKQETPQPVEKTEAEKKAEAERAAAEVAAKRIAGAFGKGTSMGSKGNVNTGSGLQGTPTGNAADGKMTGAGGYGTFDLNGRSLGEGGLPRPVYNVQEEGRVVITITVNPAGLVIGTSINKRTNTVNAALRKAAEDAAKKARFNRVDGVNNQTGTITYYFKLR